MAKTREEYQAELKELRAMAEIKASAWNNAMKSDDLKAARDAEEEMDKAIKEHNEIAQLLAFDLCERSDNVMLAAVTMLTFNIIARKDSKIPDTNIVNREIVDKDKYIDLQLLHKRVNGGIGVDKHWIYMCEQLNMQMTAFRAKALGCQNLAEINDSYAMSAIAKEIDLGKNPCSNTQLLKTLQKVITAMLGDEYKATSHDVAFLKFIYSKKGKAALSVACANQKPFRQCMAEICHRIVTDGYYTVEYKQSKK